LSVDYQDLLALNLILSDFFIMVKRSKNKNLAFALFIGFARWWFPL